MRSIIIILSIMILFVSISLQSISSYFGQVLFGVAQVDYWGNIRSATETIAMGELFSQFDKRYMRLGVFKFKDNHNSQNMCESIKNDLKSSLKGNRNEDIIELTKFTCTETEPTFTVINNYDGVVGLDKYIQNVYPKLKIEVQAKIKEEFLNGDYLNKDKVDNKTMNYVVKLDSIVIPEEYRR